MAKVKVKLRNSTVDGKAGVIYYQLSHKRKSRQITTGIRLFPEQWDARQERVVVPLTGRGGATAVFQRQIDGEELEHVAMLDPERGVGQEPFRIALGVLAGTRRRLAFDGRRPVGRGRGGPHPAH